MAETKKIFPSQNITKVAIANVVAAITGKPASNVNKRELIKQVLSLPEQEVIKHFNSAQLNYLDKSIKRKELLPVFLNREEIFKLIESCNNYQDKLMLKFALHTGCRIVELINIKTDNIDFDHNVVRINGKGNKDRYVYIADIPFMQELQSFVGNRYLKEELLFLNNRNQPFKKRAVQKKIKFIAKRAGIDPKKVSWHKIRHSYGVFCVEKGVPIPVLSRQMGHGNPATTLIYARIRDDMVKRVYDELNPTNLVISDNSEKEGLKSYRKFCSQCGNQMLEKDRFCRNCGTNQK